MHGECDRARQWLSAALDGELSEFEGVLLDAHLSGCEACRAYRVGLARATEALRAAPLEPFTASMKVRRLRPHRFRLAPAVAAFAVAAVGLGSILTSTQFRTRPKAAQLRLAEPASFSAGRAPLGGHPYDGRRTDAINTHALQIERGTASPKAAPLRGGPVVDKK